MMIKKYVSLNKLSVFLDNLKSTFALRTHEHTVSDISDFIVDETLSSTSINPVQNKVLNAEFDAIAESFAVLEAEIDNIVDVGNGSATVIVGDVVPADFKGLWFDTGS